MIALVARTTGIRPEKIGLKDRLAEDLGIDGDDAVELFEAYETELRVDLSVLYASWNKHFGPEGFPLPLGFGLVLVASIVGGVAGGLNAPAWLAVLVGLAVGLFWLIPLRAWPLPTPESHPVRVEDLITAARSGRWGDAV